MPRIAFSLLLCISLFFSCTEQVKQKNALTDYIPNETEYVLQLNNITTFWGEVINNDVLKNSELSNINKVLTNVKLIHSSSPVYYIKNNTNEALIFEHEAGTTPKDSVAGDSIPLLATDATIQPIKSLPKWFSVKYKDTYIISNNKTYIETLRNNNQTNSTITKLLSISNTKVSANLICKNNSSELLSTFKNDISTIEGWNVLDIKSTAKKLLLSGISKLAPNSNDSIYIHTQPTLSHVAKAIPENFTTFTSFSWTSPEALHLSNTTDSILSNSITELAMVETDTLKAIIALPLLPENTLEYCASEIVDTYKSHAIYKTTAKTEMNLYFQSFFKGFTPTLVTKTNDFLIFADTLPTITHHIDAVVNSKTLSENSNYNKAIAQLPENSSVLTVNKLAKNSKVSFSILQQTAHDTYFHTQALLLENKATITNQVQEVSSAQFAQALITAPVFTKNYVTKAIEVLVQDASNQLYLLDLDGNIIWKKQLDSPIQGTIEQIDMFGNGRLQYALTTEHNFYLLTRDGKNVKNFPIHFNDPISNPTAIFDYDLRHNYRFLLSQKNSLYMVDKYGKSVHGFGLTKTRGNITTTPKHIRIGKKDYITFKTDKNRLYIVDRVGKIRVPVNTKTPIDSKSDIYWYNNHFTTTTSEGNLLQISQSGKVSETQLHNTQEHTITATSKTLVTLAENKLQIKDHEITLDFGIYTKPQIYYLQQKIYVTVTDLQTNKLYLFDSNGQAITGFPVFGTTAAAMTTDEEGDVYLTTKSENNAYVVYQLPALF